MKLKKMDILSNVIGFSYEDFWMCIKYNQFPFVIQISKDEMGYVANRICMGNEL